LFRGTRGRPPPPAAAAQQARTGRRAGAAAGKPAGGAGGGSSGTAGGAAAGRAVGREPVLPHVVAEPDASFAAELAPAVQLKRVLIEEHVCRASPQNQDAGRPPRAASRGRRRGWRHRTRRGHPMPPGSHMADARRESAARGGPASRHCPGTSCAHFVPVVHAWRRPSTPRRAAPSRPAGLVR